MDTKHTPGPWTLLANRGVEVFDNYCEPLMTLDRPADELMANARLIAAAPELLEALEELMTAVEKAKNAKTAGEEQVALIELFAPARRARAAIAKAKGKA